MFGDVSDRLLGHPESVDSIVSLTEDVVLTGSSDGVIRIVGVHPNKMLGIVGQHNSMPVCCYNGHMHGPKASYMPVVEKKLLPNELLVSLFWSLADVYALCHHMHVQPHSRRMHLLSLSAAPLLFMFRLNSSP